MQYDAYPSGGLPIRAPRRRRTGRWAAAALAAALAAAWIGSTTDEAPRRVASVSDGVTRAAVRTPAAIAVREDHAWMLDPMPSLPAATPGFASSVPQEKGFGAQRAPSEPPARARAASVRPEPVRPSEPPREVAVVQSAASVPLPVPRPADLRTPAPAPQQTASLPAARPVRVAALAPAPADNRSFFEKLFGARPSTGPALGYAALGQDPVRAAPDTRVNLPAPAAGGGTAVYDISARVIHMPNGERLEAHSGLGSKLDDPRYVHVRMQGATPPGTYDLTERERLFHGVRAIRLNPVGGSAAIYGRDGILAHTYLLGPNGDSNGCVSIRDYDRFLQAFLRGEVKRLVVVPGRGGDILPNFAGRAGGPSRLSTLIAGDRS
jgi:hypothetical protein